MHRETIASLRGPRTVFSAKLIYGLRARAVAADLVPGDDLDTIKDKDDSSQNALMN